jgi:hypothetical protein
MTSHEEKIFSVSDLMKSCEDPNKTEEMKKKILQTHNEFIIFCLRGPKDALSDKKYKDLGKEPFPSKELLDLYLWQYLKCSRNNFQFLPRILNEMKEINKTTADLTDIISNLSKLRL